MSVRERCALCGCPVRRLVDGVCIGCHHDYPQSDVGRSPRYVDTDRDPELETDGGEDVDVFLDDESTIDPERTFRKKALCNHPPDAIASEYVEEIDETISVCTDCGHKLDGFELEDRDLVPDGGVFDDEVGDDLEETFELTFRARKVDLIELAVCLHSGLVAKTNAGEMTPPDHRMIHGLVVELDEILDVDEANARMVERLESGDVLVGDAIDVELDRPQIDVLEGAVLQEKLDEIAVVEGAIRDAIREKDQDDRPGAPIGDVVEDVLERRDVALSDLGLKLYEMYRQGEIYRPEVDTVALTVTDGGRNVSDRIDERRFITVEDGERVERSEREIVEDLVDRGIARPIPESPRAGERCRNPDCDEIVPENDGKRLNLGLESGYCSLLCLLEDEDDRSRSDDSYTDDRDDLRTDGGSDRVGPIIFDVREARERLESEGSVVTFRSSDRTTGETWYRYSRTGEKQGNVTVEKIADVDPALTADLRPYARDAGFQSVEDWIARIREVNGGDLRPGHLYRATLCTDDGLETDGGQDFGHKERVRFVEPYDGMRDELEVLVGDSGFVVRPLAKFKFDGKVLVQFDENKTGRAGGERHWIPTSSLEPEIEIPDSDDRLRTDGGSDELPDRVREKARTTQRLSELEAEAEGYPDEVLAPIVDVELETDGGEDEIVDDYREQRSEPGDPISRLDESKKQIEIVLEDVENARSRRGLNLALSYINMARRALE